MLDPATRVSNSVSLEQSLKICICNTFPGDTGERTTLWESLVQNGSIWPPEAYFSLLSNPQALLWLDYRRVHGLYPMLPPCLIVLPQNTSLLTQIAPILQGCGSLNTFCTLRLPEKVFKNYGCSTLRFWFSWSWEVSPSDLNEQPELRPTTLPSVSFPSRLWTLTEFSLL